jgi:hypothetical protein
MDTAAVGIAQKEDREQGIDEQDIFDGVVFFGSFQIPVDSFSAPLVVIGWQAQP